MSSVQDWFSQTPSLANIDVAALGGSTSRPISVATPDGDSSSASAWTSALGGLGKLPSFFSQQQQEDTNILGGLSWTKRMMIFIGLLGFGAFCLFMSMFFLLNLRQFAKFYTMGTLSIIGSMLFLVGPTKLFKSMFDSSRFMASLAYFGSMFFTLYCAIFLQSWILSFASVIVQIAASLWYGGSYIPFAQTLLRSTASTILPV